MAILPENELIRQIMNGNTAAFSVLVNRYQNMAFSIALKVTQNREAAEEVAQDAFMKAYRSLAGFKHEAKFSTWLYRIVYTTAISRVRRQQLATQPFDADDDLGVCNIADTQDQVRQLVATDRQVYVAAALATLPPTEQLLVNLFYEHEHPVAEIAQITGLTSTNIKVKLLRARQKLYTALSQSLKNEITELL